MPMKKLRRISMLKADTAPGRISAQYDVDEAQRADQQVGRDHAGAEEHRHQEDEQDRAVPSERGPRQPVGGQHRDDGRQRRCRPR